MAKRDPEFTCVGCGEYMINPRNHHCDPKREAQIEGARLSQEKALAKQRRMTEAERLNLGFELLNWSEEEFE